jgi:predicted  nucleic acid-binding Zn-ribbon protein
MASSLFTGIYDAQMLAILRAISNTLQNIDGTLSDMATALEDLQAQVAATTQVEASAVLLIQQIAAQLASAGTDPVALAALKDELNASAQALAAAVAANTPAAPAPTV